MPARRAFFLNETARAELVQRARNDAISIEQQVTDPEYEAAASLIPEYRIKYGRSAEEHIRRMLAWHAEIVKIPADAETKTNIELAIVRGIKNLQSAPEIYRVAFADMVELHEGLYS